MKLWKAHVYCRDLDDGRLTHLGLVTEIKDETEAGAKHQAIEQAWDERLDGVPYVEVEEDQCEVNCGGTETPGAFLADPCDLGVLAPGWVQKCDTCDLLGDDHEAWNAVRKSRGKPETRDYPFSLVASEWDEPQEQRFILSLTESVVLRTEEPDEIPSTENLALVLADNFLFNMAAEFGCSYADLKGLIDLRKVADALDLIDCEPVVEGEAL